MIIEGSKYEQQKSKVWVLIIICSICSAINNYVHNDFAVLQTSYQDLLSNKVQNFEDYYGEIYSFSLFFSIMTAILIGQGCNQIGVFLTLFIIQTISLFSQFFVYYGILKLNAEFIYIGKIIFNATVSQNGLANGILITQIFEQDQISFPISIQAVLGTVFIGLNSYFSPQITDSFGLLTNNFFLCVLQAIALGLITILVVMQMNQEDSEELQTMNSQENNNKSLSKNKKVNIDNNNNQKKDEKNDEDLKTNALTQYLSTLVQIIKDPSFLILTIIISSYFIYTTIFSIIGVNFLQENYSFSQEYAGKIMSLMNIMTLSLPILGKLVDYTNEKTISYLQYAGFLSILASTLIIYQNPLIGCAIYGISNSLRILLFFPNVQKVLHTKKIRNVGNSFIKAFENLLASIIIYENGRIFDIFQSYKGMMYFCCGFAIIGTILSIFLNQTFNNQKVTLEDQQQLKQTEFNQQLQQQEQLQQPKQQD